MNALKNSRTLLILEGMLFIIFGFLAIIMPGISTASIELFLGSLALFAGCVQLYRTLTNREAPSFYGSLLTSALYILFGILLLANPLSGIITLTILLMIFFIIEGVAKIYWGFSIRPSANSILFIINGILALALAVIIFYGWPGTALWVPGLLLGINMTFFGVALLILGISHPSQS